MSDTVVNNTGVTQGSYRGRSCHPFCSPSTPRTSVIIPRPVTCRSSDDGGETTCSLTLDLGVGDGLQQAKNTSYTCFHPGGGCGYCAGLQVPWSAPGQQTGLGEEHQCCLREGLELTQLFVEALVIQYLQFHAEDVLVVCGS